MADEATAGPATTATTAMAAQVSATDRLMPVFSSAELFGAATEIAIVHADSVYRLRITRQGKLILNK